MPLHPFSRRCSVPLYEYLCAKCKKRFEKIEKLNAPRKQKCPHCGGKAERQLSASGFQFKGSGWYVTDYARSGSGSAGKKEDAGASSESKETKETKDSKESKETKESKDSKGKKKGKS